MVTLTEEILNGKLRFLCSVGPHQTSLFEKSSIMDNCLGSELAADFLDQVI